MTIEYDLDWYKVMYGIRTKEKENWRESAEEIAGERDMWYQAYKTWCEIGTKARNTLTYMPEER